MTLLLRDICLRTVWMSVTLPVRESAAIDFCDAGGCALASGDAIPRRDRMVAIGCGDRHCHTTGLGR